MITPEIMPIPAAEPLLDPEKEHDIKRIPKNLEFNNIITPEIIPAPAAEIRNRLCMVCKKRLGTITVTTTAQGDTHGICQECYPEYLKVGKASEAVKTMLAGEKPSQDEFHRVVEGGPMAVKARKVVDLIKNFSSEDGDPVKILENDLSFIISNTSINLRKDASLPRLKQVIEILEEKFHLV